MPAFIAVKASRQIDNKPLPVPALVIFIDRYVYHQARCSLTVNQTVNDKNILDYLSDHDVTSFRFALYWLMNGEVPNQRNDVQFIPWHFRVSSVIKTIYVNWKTLWTLRDLIHCIENNIHHSFFDAFCS